MLRHAVFFETLASTRDETSPEWKSVVAGLLVLRLVDDWLDFGMQVVTTDITGLRAVQQAVAEVPLGDPARAVLLGILETLNSAEVADLELVAARLIAYARSLHFNEKWALAQDVLESLADRAGSAQCDDMYINALMQLGYVHRMTSNWQQALASYDKAEAHASAAGIERQRLRAQLGRAKINTDRGNLPAALATITSVIDAAERLNLDEVLAIALHDRTFLALHRDEFPEAVLYGYRALQLTSDSSTKEVILTNIAAGFFGLGHLEAAREAFTIVSLTAQAQIIRWTAEINLLELASCESDEATFRRIAIGMEEAALPPRMAANYQKILGEGWQRLGYPEDAEVAFKTVIDIAQAHQLNQLIIAAEASLATLKNASQPKHEYIETTSLSPALTAVASAIHELHVLAGTNIHGADPW